MAVTAIQFAISDGSMSTVRKISPQTTVVNVHQEALRRETLLLEAHPGVVC
jgi:hypothetical protein